MSGAAPAAAAAPLRPTQDWFPRRLGVDGLLEEVVTQVIPLQKETERLVSLALPAGVQYKQSRSSKTRAAATAESVKELVRSTAAGRELTLGAKIEAASVGGLEIGLKRSNESKSEAKDSEKSHEENETSFEINEELNIEGSANATRFTLYKVVLRGPANFYVDTGIRTDDTQGPTPESITIVFSRPLYVKTVEVTRIPAPDGVISELRGNSANLTYRLAGVPSCYLKAVMTPDPEQAATHFEIVDSAQPFPQEPRYVHLYDLPNGTGRYIIPLADPMQPRLRHLVLSWGDSGPAGYRVCCHDALDNIRNADLFLLTKA